MLIKGRILIQLELLYPNQKKIRNNEAERDRHNKEPNLALS